MLARLVLKLLFKENRYLKPNLLTLCTNPQIIPLLVFKYQDKLRNGVMVHELVRKARDQRFDPGI